jgi:hypothetical protein
MLLPMKIKPPIRTPAKISMPILLGPLDIFSCTEWRGWTATGGAVVAADAEAADETVAITLLSHEIRRPEFVGQLGKASRDACVIWGNCYVRMNIARM